MTAVNNDTTSDILAALNKRNETADEKKAKTSASGALGQDTFLKLLVTQMQNQNPLDPQDNTQFVSQLAQFSSLEGITSLNDTVSGLANSLQSNQAVQASALVGRSVEVESDKANLATGGVVQGEVSLPDSTASLQIKIYDSKDKLVYSADLGAQNAGDIPFVWDGTDADGAALDPGSYKFVATANDTGKSTALTTYLVANVDSVTIGADKAVSLSVNGIGPVALSDVKNFL
jgi:flagellar basal-body rod modification protein FlgD